MVVNKSMVVNKLIHFTLCDPFLILWSNINIDNSMFNKITCSYFQLFSSFEAEIPDAVSSLK